MSKKEIALKILEQCAQQVIRNALMKSQPVEEALTDAYNTIYNNLDETI